MNLEMKSLQMVKLSLKAVNLCFLPPIPLQKNLCEKRLFHLILFQEA